MDLVQDILASCGESNLIWYVVRFAASILGKAVWECGVLGSVNIRSARISRNECVREMAVMVLIVELGLKKQEFHSICPWEPGFKCLNNDEASLT